MNKTKPKKFDMTHMQWNAAWSWSRKTRAAPGPYPFEEAARYAKRFSEAERCSRPRASSRGVFVVGIDRGRGRAQSEVVRWVLPSTPSRYKMFYDQINDEARRIVLGAVEPLS